MDQAASGAAGVSAVPAVWQDGTGERSNILDKNSEISYRKEGRGEMKRCGVLLRHTVS